MSNRTSGNGSGPLPNWLTWSIVGALAVLFIINVGLDYHSGDYDGQGESIIIAGLLGGVLGLDQWKRDK